MKSVITMVALSVHYPVVQAATLDEAVVAAQAKSHSVGMVHQQRIIAQAQLGQVRFSLLPSVFVNGSYTVNQYEITMDPTEWVPEEFAGAFGEGAEPTLIQEKDYLAASLRVDQTLFDSRTLPGLKAATENLAAARAAEQRAERLMKARVAQMAYGVQAARDAMDLAKRGLDMAQVQLDLAEARKDLGGSSRRDYLQAQLASSKAKRDLRSAEEYKSDLELAFSQMTGFERNVPLDLKVSLVLPVSLQEALSRARSQRQDLMSARSTEASAYAVHRATRWSFMPRISASFLTSYTENTMFTDEPLSWMGLVNAQFALWDGGRTRAQKAMERAKWKMATHGTEQTSEKVEREVEQAWSSLARAKQAVEAVGIEVSLATENLALSEMALSNGGASWVDVERSRLGLQAAEMASLRERTALRMAEVGLLVATGQY
jgi:outer membrane protein TolC